MPTAPPKTAACQPKVGGGKNSTPRPRCRLARVCDGTTEDLRIRRIRREGGEVAPTLCCGGCAEGQEA